MVRVTKQRSLSFVHNVGEKGRGRFAYFAFDMHLTGINVTPTLSADCSENHIIDSNYSLESQQTRGLCRIQL